jgi:hypothetical protein
MDITTTELKTMKAKQLRRLIQEVINEDVLNEDPTKSKNLRIQAAKLSQQAATLKKQAADEETKDAQQDTQAAANESLDEMARLAKGFRLADPNINTSQYATKRISGTSMADVIEFFRENPGAEKTALQAQFGFVRPQIANAIVNGLLDAGVLVKLGAGGEEEAPVTPGETAPTQATEPEDMFMGSAENPLSMYFDDEPNADGSENFTDDEEPDAGEIEKSNMAAGGMSDADYEAWMKYGELKQRLDSTKSNILKLRKNKGGSFGDISDKPSTELQRLRDLKLSLEERIAALVASSPYLQAKLKKEEPIVPVIEPEETEVEPLDEWTIRKMQYYAGISK